MKENEVDEFINDIGKRIRELRKAQKMTQLDLAIKSNVDERQIQRLEASHTSATLKTLYKVIKGLDTDFETFFKGM